MRGQSTLLNENASLHIQIDTDQTSLSQDVALRTRTRFLWTGFGFAVFMLIGVSACALHPLASHASAEAARAVPAVASFGPIPALGPRGIRPLPGSRQPVEWQPALSSRRAVLGSLGALALVAAAPPSTALGSLIVDEKASARDAAVKTAASLPDALEDLPKNAKKAYLQYLPQLQLDGDYFVFELEPLLSQPGRWDLISEVCTQGQAGAISRLEREFIAPMRQLSLSFPPDMGGDDMQKSIDGFQQAMYTLASQAKKGSTAGNVALPSKAEMKGVEDTYNLAVTSLSSFFAAVNEGVGTKRLEPVPKAGVYNEGKPGEPSTGYPRSKSLYIQLKKDAALCRNRGGEALAGLWGNLMVYGTVPGVNPCGNGAQKYFSQGL